MDRELRNGLILILLLGAAALFVAYLAGGTSCRSKAGAMGMRPSFGFFQGCMVEHAPGKWVPLANYRVQ